MEFEDFYKRLAEQNQHRSKLILEDTIEQANKSADKSVVKPIEELPLISDEELNTTIEAVIDKVDKVFRPAFPWLDMHGYYELKYGKNGRY